MKKKLLFLTVAFDTGGTEKATYDIITHINPEKYDITLMTMYGGGYFQSKLPDYVHIKWFFPRFIRYVIRYVEYFPAKLVYKTFIHDKYDVEIACGDNMPSRIINHSPNLKSKKLAWIHMDVIARGYKGYEMRTKRGRDNFYKNFDAIVNVSKDCEAKFKQKFGDTLPTCTIYNLIDAEDIRSKASKKPELTLPDDCFNIVCIGRYAEEKGFDRLIDAYAQIKGKGIPKCRITVIGEGIDRPLLEQMIAEHNLEDDIKLVGYIENPYAVLKQADLFLLSSRDEAFALVVAEAMVLGVPVMSTRCTGPVELLKDGKAGMLIENSTEAIRDGLLNILTDSKLYDDMKQTAIDNMDNFHVEKQVGEIEALLDS